MATGGLPRFHRYRIPGIAATISRLILAGVFLVASVPKLLDMAAFARAVGYYRMLPAPWHLPAALLLASMEFVLGVLLATGVYRRTAAVLVVGLNLVFLVAMGQALVRGIDISCGCFGTGAPLAWGDLVRDMVFIGLALVVWKDGVDEQR